MTTQDKQNFEMPKEKCGSFIKNLIDAKIRFNDFIDSAFRQYNIDYETKSGEELFTEFVERYLLANTILTDSVKKALIVLEEA